MGLEVALRVAIVCVMAIDTGHRARPRSTRSTVPRRAAPRRRRAPWVLAALGLALVGVAGAVVVWSRASLADDPVALARVTVGPLAGRLESVVVLGADGRLVATTVRGGRLTPRSGLIAPGEHVSVEVVVRRPGALSWLLGSELRQRLTLTAPSARMTSPRITAPGGVLRVTFDHPVDAVAYGSPAPGARQHLRRPQDAVVIDQPAAAGTLEVANAARSWERLGASAPVTWFPATRSPVAVVSPAADTTISPTTPLRLTFSRRVGEVLGSARPVITPDVPGHWRQIDDYTLTFTPSGGGAELGTRLLVRLPRSVALLGPGGALHTVSSIGWTVPPGSTLRLQQVLAQLGYLPFTWTATGAAVQRDLAAQVQAAVTPPAGDFSSRYADMPAPLRGLWHAGLANDVTRGAVIAFESSHGLTADGFPGPQVWNALLADAIADKRTTQGYSYVYVHRDQSPQTLTLWHNGRTVLTTPGNTGLAAAPTQLGTFPVFEHLAVTTMSGTNPGGSNYSDPGIKWVSYFNGGDAIHAFDRASFGTPQSLGCVELPLAAAAAVWPYTPIGTLVTIES
jgi:L,D-transpeptidase catalytic domain